MEALSRFLGTELPDGSGVVEEARTDDDGKTLIGYRSGTQYFFAGQSGAPDFSAPSAVPLGRPCPVGTTLVSESGRTIGRILDLRLRGTSIVAYEVARSFRTSRDRFVTEADRTMRIRAKKPEPDATAPSESEPAPRREPTFGIPARIISDYSFLLGRYVTEDIADGDEIVIRKGELVVAETVLRARNRYKLLDLTLKSKL